MIYDLIQKYGSSNETIKILCEELSEHLPEDEYEGLAKAIYESTQGKHFDKCFAEAQIKKMYYEEGGTKYYGPYWKDLTTIYDVHKRNLVHPYNKWDFEVTMNMIKSDYYPLLKKWFPDEQDYTDKIIELSINWLNDEDNPFGESKIWCYFR